MRAASRVKEMKLGRTFSSMQSFKVANKQMLINGKFVSALTGKTFDSFNPATEERICSIAEADIEDVNLAVQAAASTKVVVIVHFTTFSHVIIIFVSFHSFFLVLGPWRKMAASERGRCLFRLADLIEKHQDELAALESMDNGYHKT